jgi:hypothetical protein
MMKVRDTGKFVYLHFSFIFWYQKFQKRARESGRSSRFLVKLVVMELFASRVVYDMARVKNEMRCTAGKCTDTGRDYSARKVAEPYI